jgi:adenylate cyclase
MGAKRLAPVSRDGERRQFDQMNLLMRVARQVAAHDTLDQMLHAVVAASVEQTKASRGTLFLNDDETGELYSRVAQGTGFREIRILNNTGISGQVFHEGKGAIVHDPYNHPRFNRTIDQETGFITRSILCAPVRSVKGEVLGVLQMLNRTEGLFDEDDLRLLEAMTSHVAMTLRSAQQLERMAAVRQKEMKFLDLVSDVTQDIDLNTMLARVVGEAARMLQADRATLFLNDEKKNELFSRVAMGNNVGEIRLPNNLGIAGAVFTSGQAINIPYAYADLRFNPAFDKRTGYFTRSILCVPITNKAGKVIGVTQVLNKRGGPFNDEDLSRLKAFTAQLAISLENAKLFDDVQNMKNYNESVLQSMSSGVLTLNEEGKIITCNTAGQRIFKTGAGDLLLKPAAEFFVGENTWIMDRVKYVDSTQQQDIRMDAELVVEGVKVSANVTFTPLVSSSTEKPGKLGTMIMIEDISSEKRMKSTMSRYMDPGVADQLLAGGDDILGGKSVLATILFSDVRNFTAITEELGPHGTVSLLNEYFTIMVDCIQKQGGMLDKFIGDAIMAAFGLPVGHDDDADRAVRATIAMIREMRAWNATRVAQGKKPIDMGIGLNTDTVVSGNIGSPKRMDYTIIGDGVNLAARLESACKQYGARILISENTLVQLKGTYRVREADQVVVMGKTEPVGVFELLDYHTAETFPNLIDALDVYRSGLEAYKRGDWCRAISFFDRALEMNPKDALPALYNTRCRYLKENPPEKEWDGIWVLTEK